MESEDKEEKWEMKNGKGKGVHDNGKRSNRQILSQTAPFPVEYDVQPTQVCLSEYRVQQMAFSRLARTVRKENTLLTDG